MSTCLRVVCDCGIECLANGSTTADCEICDSCIDCCDKDNYDEEDDNEENN